MIRVEGNNWFIKGNTISRSLQRFALKVEMKKSSKGIYYKMVVVNSNLEELKFTFYSLEDVIDFGEKIYKASSEKEIIDTYIEMFGNKVFTITDGIEEKKEKMELTKEEVNQAIADYFGEGKSYSVSVEEELSVYNRVPSIHFYLIEHYEIGGIKKDNKILLTNGDLTRALEAYVEYYDKELIDFKYLGGVHSVGYFVEEDIPHYEGIELTVKEKDLGRSYSYKKEDV